MKNLFPFNLAFFICLFCSSCEVSPKENSTPPKASEENLSSLNVEDSKTLPVPVNEFNFVYGVDISQFQGKEAGILNSKNDSLSFIICKATEGITFIDPMFKYNWHTIAEKGFIRGSYHFYRTNDDPVKQAQNYLNRIQGLQKTDLPPIVDFEEGSIVGTQSMDTIQADLLVFLNTIENKLERKPMIYTDINTGNKYLNKNEFSLYALWVANYTTDSQPELPTTWETVGWKFWQRTSKYRINKIENDFDLFNGSIKDLKEFIKNY